MTPARRIILITYAAAVMTVAAGVIEEPKPMDWFHLGALTIAAAALYAATCRKPTP
jgi:uncharacterized membrane protein